MVSWQDDRTLTESDLDADPHRQFRTWLREATESGEPMPNAMAVATSSPDGWPSVRMILLEEVDEHGFVFQTNLESPKARDLEAVPRAAFAFFWPILLSAVWHSVQQDPIGSLSGETFDAGSPPSDRNWQPTLAPRQRCARQGKLARMVHGLAAP
jgi:pyridoxamine 5'-phosphate oxidase